MTAEVEHLLREAEQLSPDEREDLALRILDGIAPDPGYDEAWDREIARRLRELDDGTVTPISGQEMLAIIDAAARGERRLPPNAS
jgi:putative addiction module component (TIGR02574 family)